MSLTENINFQFVDVILPLALPNLYTYEVPEQLIGKLSLGQRIVVQFGAQKVYHCGEYFCSASPRLVCHKIVRRIYR